MAKRPSAIVLLERFAPGVLRSITVPKLIIILLVVAAALCLGSLVYLQYENSSIVERDMQSAVALSEIAARFDHEDGNLYRLMLDEAVDGRSPQVAQDIQRIRGQIAQIAKDLEAQQRFLAAEERRRAASVVTEIRQYDEAVGVVSSMLELDFATSVAMLRPFRENADRVLSEVKSIATSGIAKAHAHAGLAALRSRILVAIISVVILLVAVLSYLWLALAAQRGAQLQEEMKRRGDAEREALLLARTDTLTGLANRRVFNAELVQALAQNQDNRSSLAVILLDLDRFKEANDSFGHAAGDAVLTETAERLRRFFGEEAVIARLGGDEFAVLATSESDDEAVVTAQARIASSLLQQPVIWRDNSITVGASIGIARYPIDATEADALLHAADLAMYRAKAVRNGGVQLFSPALEIERASRRRLEEELRAGARACEIRPFYQPIVRLGSGELAGYEVLARWQHPRLGLLSPSAFIRIAEDSGQITDITCSLLRQTCRVARTMPKDLTFSINISPVQLVEPDLATALIEIIHQEKVDPSCIEIEITENAVMDDIGKVESVLAQFRASGMTIALDDFGTGYSSLSNLQRLKFDKLKIDQSFVHVLQSSQESQKLVEATIALALSLGMSITAEGVEDAEAAAFLAERGCTYGQGWLFGRPAPFEQIVTQGADLAERAA